MRYFAVSTWDGNEVGSWMAGLGVTDPAELAARSSRSLSPAERTRLAPEYTRKSKALQYMADGQTYPPERAAGAIQFGMWLMRPRVVREFRGHANKLAPVEPYWLETVKAVDRVHADRTLKEFWRHGKLVANTAREHPYDADLPQRYRDTQRWFALDTNLDPPRPWNLRTKLPVFCLALVRGEVGSRRWLLYGHAPVERQEGVEVTIPDYGRVTLNVPRAGAFYLLTEKSGMLQQVANGN